MKTMRRRSEFLFLLFCLDVIIPEVSCVSESLATIYERQGIRPRERNPTRKQRQITFRNTFQDIPESLQKSVFNNRSNGILQEGPQYYVILSDVPSTTISNLIDIFSNNGRIYFSPKVNVLDRVDDSNLSEKTKTKSKFRDFHPKLTGRSIDGDASSSVSPQKFGKSLLDSRRSRSSSNSENPEIILARELVPPSESYSGNSLFSEEKITQQTPERIQNLPFSIQNRRTRAFSKPTTTEGPVNRRNLFFEDLHSDELDHEFVGRNEISQSPSKNLSKRDDMEMTALNSLDTPYPPLNQSRPDFLSFIKHRSKNFIIKNEDRIGVADSEYEALPKPRPTIGKLVDMWKRMNTRYRNRQVTPPTSLMKRKPTKKSLRASSLPAKQEAEVAYSYETSDNTQGEDEVTAAGIRHRKSLQIQAQEASQRQERRLKAVNEFSTHTEVSNKKSSPIENSLQVAGNDQRGRENHDFTSHDTYEDATNVPHTSFSCSHDGYYADAEAQCRVFHVCWGRRKASFVCPSGTAFSQKLQVCAWRKHVECNYT